MSLIKLIIDIILKLFGLSKTNEIPGDAEIDAKLEEIDNEEYDADSIADAINNDSE